LSLPLEDFVADGTLVAVAVVDSFSSRGFSVEGKVELVVEGGASLRPGGGDVELAALLVAEAGVGHEGDHVPVTGELRNKSITIVLNAGCF